MTEILPVHERRRFGIKGYFVANKAKVSIIHLIRIFRFSLRINNLSLVVLQEQAGICFVKFLELFLIVFI